MKGPKKIYKLDYDILRTIFEFGISLNKSTGDKNLKLLIYNLAKSLNLNVYNEKHRFIFDIIWNYLTPEYEYNTSFLEVQKYFEEFKAECQTFLGIEEFDRSYDPSYKSNTIKLFSRYERLFKKLDLEIHYNYFITLVI